MIYYTQLIFIKQGCETEFNLFEAKVLPLLKNHNGNLVYRIRPDRSSLIEGTGELPHEIHIVTFGSKTDFEGYKNDPQRLAFMDLKNRSVQKIILIQGEEL
jgi:hypothetical protein